MKNRWTHLTLALALAFMSLWMIALPARQSAAAPQADLLYVSSVSGNDAGNLCTNPQAPCQTLQHAVDRATPGSEIRIAGLDNETLAVYTGWGAYPVVAVDKSLTLRGGYVYVHGGLVNVWDRTIPAISVVDGEKSRPGIEITGDVTVTLDLLAFINGQGVRGGNLYAENARLQLVATPFLSGTATYGGGLYLKNCRTSIDPGEFDLGDLTDLSGMLIVRGNRADYGGGLYVEGGDPALTTLGLVSNTAAFDGGGLYVQGGAPILAGGLMMENHAGRHGGGLYLKDSAARLAGTAVTSNTAAHGAGLYVDGPLALPLTAPALANTIIRHNHTPADGKGGGVHLHSAVATFVNAIVADNSAGEGGAIYLEGSSPLVLHATLAQNGGSSGVYLTHSPASGLLPPIPSLPVFTNTIVASHTVGVYAESTGLPYPLQNRADLNGTLWWANDEETGGAGLISLGDTNVHGDPRFTCTGDPPGCLRPYHILTGSAAIDSGAVVGTLIPGIEGLIDIDGEMRPSGEGFDLGADELVTRTYDVWLLPPLSARQVAPGERVTHTHLLLNTGQEADTYDVTFRSSHGWAAILEPTPINLRAQSSTTVRIAVTVPLTAADGISDTTALTATSRANADRRARALDFTSVVTGSIATFNVALVKEADGSSVAPGAAVHYTLSLSRSGTLTQSVAYTLTDTLVPTRAIAGWTLPPACDGNSELRVVTCTGTLPGTLLLHYAIAVTTTPDYSGTLLNSAIVRTGRLESNLLDNFDQVTVNVSENAQRIYLPLVLRSGS